MHTQSDEMVERVTSCGDYYKALSIISEYVDTELSIHTGAPGLHSFRASASHSAVQRVQDR